MNPRLRPALLFVAALALAGCETTSSSTASSQTAAPELHPVSNPIPARPAGVYEISQVSVAPEFIYRGHPGYPNSLAKSGVTGDVLVMYTVTDNGGIRDIVVLSATDRAFARSATDAVQQWRYHPAQLNHQAVNCRMEARFNFTESDE